MIQPTRESYEYQFSMVVSASSHCPGKAAQMALPAYASTLMKDTSTQVVMSAFIRYHARLVDISTPRDKEQDANWRFIILIFLNNV